MANPNTGWNQSLELDGTIKVVFNAEILPTSPYYAERVSIVEGVEAANPTKLVYTYDINGASIGPRKRPQ